MNPIVEPADGWVENILPDTSCLMRIIRVTLILFVAEA
jgi:hypothetical protein